MMTEPMTGLYALTVFAAFIFFSWEERRDAETSDEWTLFWSRSLPSSGLYWRRYVSLLT